MSLPETDHLYLDGVGADRLAQLLMELASQLHAERQRRVALEILLERAGVLAPGALDAMAGDAEARGRAQASLDGALRRLLRIMAEQGGPRAPLRAEAL
jgi:hypothetical protein